jgi:very-short-patch-repair endonuclease
MPEERVLKSLEQYSHRLALVEAARKDWTRRLIDPSRRNTLLFFKPLKKGTFDLSQTKSDVLDRVLRGDSVPITDIAGTKDETLLSPFRTISRRARANSEEKGLSTLFLAFGLASWDAGDGGRDYAAPVLFLPVEMPEQRMPSSMKLSRTGAPEVNLALLHVLRERCCNISSDDLIGEDWEEEADEATRFSMSLETLAQIGIEIPGFRVAPFCVLGNFSFQKMAIVADLNRLAGSMANHNLVAAIAGDEDARRSILSGGVDVDPKSLDAEPAEKELLICDADSSQHSAITGVIKGQHLVIHGPPGTGKSQTIANLIVLMASQGKRILFVAEKRAALTVVKDRLKRVGLDHLLLDLYGADQKPKVVMERLARALDRIRESTHVDGEWEHQRFSDLRMRLNQHVQRIHQPRKPVGRSAFWIRGRLLTISECSSLRTRWRGESLIKLDEHQRKNIEDLLAEAETCGDLFLRKAASLWSKAILSKDVSLESTLDLLRAALNDLDSLLMWLTEINSLEVSCDRGPSWRELKEVLSVMSRTNEILGKYRGTLFALDLERLCDITKKSTRGLLGRAWAWISDRDFRRGIKALRKQCLSKPANPSALHHIANEALEVRTIWSKYFPQSDPTMTADAENRDSQFDRMRQALKHLVGIGIKLDYSAQQLPDLRAMLAQLEEEERLAWKMLRVSELESRLADLDASAVVDELRRRQEPLKDWPRNFEHAWLSSALDHACSEDPALRTFVGEAHARSVSEFRKLDLERQRLAAATARRAHAEHAIAAMNQFPIEEQVIRTEAARARRFKPLRRVLSEAQNVMTAVCPCLMASPLSVSQLMEGQQEFFDYVLFDEASQVLPEDSIAAILRGKYIVVAGDNKQLPPSPFFVSGEDETREYSEETEVDGFESLLDMMIPITHGYYLRWHYRSRDESLIAFSNKQIYDWRLVTFPSTSRDCAVKHNYVEQKRLISPVDSPSEEVEAVVSLILDHARSKPEISLGVIALGINHANRIQDFLDARLSTCPELFDFFDPECKEPFFIKNLERVQGDERDRIILSLGHGRVGGENLDLRVFGPLNSKNGRRRLNVAITRAREQMIVTSAFHSSDIDLTKVKPGTGIELLRSYLQYSESGGQILADGEAQPVPLNDFEQDIFDSLSAQGMKLVPQVGASGYRIDMAAVHPEKPGEYVLAIECDGASYHSAPTARDRDRLRQQQLERLGWRFHRIWSTDWFSDKHAEIERALNAYRLSINAAVRSSESSTGTARKVREPGEKLADLKPQRGPKPKIPSYNSISDYQLEDLIQLIEWIQSDGLLRSDEELVSELIPLLGFRRRGSRIEEELRFAIESSRESNP